MRLQQCYIWLQARCGGSAVARLLSAHPCPRRHRLAATITKAAATVAAPERPPVQPMPKPLVSTLHKLAFDRDSLPSLGVQLIGCHQSSTLLPGRACLPVASAISCETTHQAVILTLVDCLGAADPSHFQDAEQQFLQLLRTPDLDKQFRCFTGMRCPCGKRPVCGRQSYGLLVL